MVRLTRSRFLRQLTAGFLGLFCALVFAACGSSTTPAGGDAASTGASPAAGGAADTLTFAIEPTFAPFEFNDSNGQLTGFDVDLLNAIGKEAGFTVNYQTAQFDGMIPALQAGTIDGAISAMTIKPERAQVVDFSRPYYRSGLAIAVQSSNTDITSFDHLSGKRIAAQTGTTGASKAEEANGDVRLFDNLPLALQELSNGNVDAVVHDAPAILYAIKTGSVKNIKTVGDLLTEEYYGIPLPKGSPNLERVNQGLTAIIENGTYAEIYRKWFGAEPPELPETAPGIQ
ncbi:basic amino acid ABC transporter substrate-binding protein [Microcoleus sp. FACHB-1515]|uniref:basic amino acid ABC transporter substrate-binding protein n=1 Tax=Cyanophyceae TaxID=3028117 RepID=UPI001685A08A|nr:basic amino acid ABC transporter substrate-binding protein [Microcoleus sp. FACHB-1515]MBD2091475.1 basic amino acid ABC transporter substrate-binding protein [Microcoleus sp. FACHB-1515]